MVNIEHKLTVDDLIVEYMAYKVRNGYEPSFLTSEFISFLYFFESKMPVEDANYENEKLFKRFFERKCESDGSKSDPITKEKIKAPHMDYIEKENDYLIKANYKLSSYDMSIINTYFNDNGMGKYEDFKGETYKIRNIIGEFLKDQEKRKIDTNLSMSNEEIMIGEYIAAEIIINIWESYIKKLVENKKWPMQCIDINKYLFEMDLAKIIGLDSIKNKIIELYRVLSKRISILYHNDKDLRISTFTDGFLARANYDYLIRDYEKIMNTIFSENGKSLDIDLPTLVIKESHKLDGIYDFDEDPEIKTTSCKVGNNQAKHLVLSMNKITYGGKNS